MLNGWITLYVKALFEHGKFATNYLNLKISNPNNIRLDDLTYHFFDENNDNLNDSITINIFFHQKPIFNITGNMAVALFHIKTKALISFDEITNITSLEAFFGFNITFIDPLMKLKEGLQNGTIDGNFTHITLDDFEEISYNDTFFLKIVHYSLNGLLYDETNLFSFNPQDEPSSVSSSSAATSISTNTIIESSPGLISVVTLISFLFLSSMHYKRKK